MNIIENIKKIRLEKSINQDVLAFALDVDPAVVSNIEKGKRELKVNELEIIASCLSVDVLYLFTYPKTYVDPDSLKSSERISITFEVSPDKREHLLRMVTGGKE